MVGVSSLEAVLDELLRKRSLREDLGRRCFERMNLSPEDAGVLAAVDCATLERAAAALRREVRARCHRGSGKLEELYPSAIAAWRAQHPDDRDLDQLFERFVASEAFAAHGHGPGPTDGLRLCIEESFFHFCEAESLGSAEERLSELLAATMKALLVSPAPAFAVPACVRRAPRGFFGLATRAGSPILFAATGGRFVTGALTPFLAALLGSEDHAAVAREHGVGPGELASSLEALAGLGLVKTFFPA